MDRGDKVSESLDNGSLRQSSECAYQRGAGRDDLKHLALAGGKAVTELKIQFSPFDIHGLGRS
jgi:hypothetical protein